MVLTVLALRASRDPRAFADNVGFRVSGHGCVCSVSAQVWRRADLELLRYVLDGHAGMV